MSYNRTTTPPEAPGLAYIMLLGVMTLGGTLGNIMVIGATLTHKILRTPTNVFVVNLALADMSVSLGINIFNIMGSIDTSYFIRHHHFCVGVAFVCHTVCLASMWTIAVISVNRYVAILHHQRYPYIFTWRNSILLCVLVWLLCLLLATPPFFGFGVYLFHTKALGCGFANDYHMLFNIYMVTIVFGVPLSGILYCYTRIYLFVAARKRALRAKTNKVHLPGVNNKEKEETKLARTLFLVFLGFLACYGPYSMIMLFDFQYTWPNGVYLFAGVSAHISSSGLNFIIYGVTNKQFRDGYRKFLAVVCNGKCVTSVDVGSTRTH